MAVERKLFFVFIARPARHNARVIGAILNALGILLGALLGLTGRGQLSVRWQNFSKSAIGGLLVLCGLQLVWLNVSGGFLSVLKQFSIAALAVALGNLLGKILRLKKISNRLGRHASALLATGQSGTGRPAAGFIAATILFCAAPLGILGAVTDGLTGYFFPLVIKAAMDGLAMMSFVKLFRWPAALAAVPVFLFLNGISLAVHKLALPGLESSHLLHAIGAAAGFVVCPMALVALEVRRVELANYLPALAVAPPLTHLLG